MKPEYIAVAEIRNILETLEDDADRLQVLELLKEDFCFYCGNKNGDCQCWNQK
jgi:hypothetical protein